MQRYEVAKDADHPSIKLPDIISALSFALDLTEGAIPGHAVRSTLLGMRIGAAVGLSSSLLRSLYYALQLKDVGCSSNAARMTQLFGGDDRRAKAVTKLTDWSGLRGGSPGHESLRERVRDLSVGLAAVPRSARLLWSAVSPEGGLRRRLGYIAALNRNVETNSQELFALRCDRGAMILRKLAMGDLTCESVFHLDERWDGTGYPNRLAGEEIPLLARICAVAQNLDVFATAQGIEASIRTLKRRSGSWFDPEIVRAALALHRGGRLWTDCEPHCAVEVTRHSVVAHSPESVRDLQADQIDGICEAFSDVVDAKSPFTFRHSLGVTEVTRMLAEEMDLPPTRQVLLKRAALLHDLGKLGVPNSILDKPGALTAEEREIISEHPGMSRVILNRIAGFEEIAQIAGQHHEKLDGSGYPDGLSSAELPIESRLLTIADCFTALAEERPYRAALPLPQVLNILRREAPLKLDQQIFEVLEVLVTRWGDCLPPVFRSPAHNNLCAVGV